jgi:hypothetical protein
MDRSANSLRGALHALAIFLTFGLFAPFGADAQPAKAARIRYLSGNPRSDTKDALAAFRAKLRSLGYLEGRISSLNRAMPRATTTACPSWQPSWSGSM